MKKLLGIALFLVMGSAWGNGNQVVSFGDRAIKPHKPNKIKKFSPNDLPKFIRKHQKEP